MILHRPMLAILLDQPFDDPDWIFELKYDGYRALAQRRSLYSRNSRNLDSQFPHIAEELKKIVPCILDGEIVVFDSNGKSSLQLLQNRPQQAQYMVFDILFLKGHDLRQLPLIERKKILSKLITKRLKYIHLCQYIEERGTALFTESQKHQLEGIIGKKKSAPYLSKRSRLWVKIKGIHYLDGYILGYTAGKQSLILGDAHGNRIGKVGTGFTQDEFEKIARKLDRASIPPMRCRVGFLEWTEDKKLRHPRFIELIKEPYSNLEKYYWPKERITKGDLIAYYRHIAPVILPHLKDRPQVLHRFPDGIEGTDFYQKKAGNLSKDMPSTYVKPNERYLLAQDQDSLLYLINLGCIDLNPFTARVGSLNLPDYLVIDLDPRGIPFKSVVKVAQEFKKQCDMIGLKSFPKTSGKQGLHIYIPIQAEYDFDTVRSFAQLLSYSIHKQLPQITSVVRDPHKRQGKIYLDYLQNRPHTPMASVYSVRPLPGAPVSTPLEWSEVNARLDPSRFTLSTTLKRLDKKGDLFAGVLRTHNRLEKAMRKIKFNF